MSAWLIPEVQCDRCFVRVVAENGTVAPFRCQLRSEGWTYRKAPNPYAASMAQMNDYCPDCSEAMDR